MINSDIFKVSVIGLGVFSFEFPRGIIIDLLTSSLDLYVVKSYRKDMAHNGKSALVWSADQWFWAVVNILSKVKYPIHLT